MQHNNYIIIEYNKKRKEYFLKEIDLNRFDDNTKKIFKNLVEDLNDLPQKSKLWQIIFWICFIAMIISLILVFPLHNIGFFIFLVFVVIFIIFCIIWFILDGKHEKKYREAIKPYRIQFKNRFQIRRNNNMNRDMLFRYGSKSIIIIPIINYAETLRLRDFQVKMEQEIILENIQANNKNRNNGNNNNGGNNNFGGNNDGINNNGGNNFGNSNDKNGEGINFGNDINNLDNKNRDNNNRINNNDYQPQHYNKDDFENTNEELVKKVTIISSDLKDGKDNKERFF